MALKTAGPERDREIAELMGLEYEIHTGRPSVDGFVSVEPIEFVTVSGSVKMWSTSIIDSMELWEEMKGTGSLTLETFDTSLINHVRCTLELPAEVYFYHEAETEAAAISGAWQKWKEAE